MLVVTPDEMKRMEEAAALKGITNEMLMEEAGKGIAKVIVSFVKQYNLTQKALVLAGKGNNGGDAYVVARHLQTQGFLVQVWQTAPLDPASLARKERRRFEARSGKVIDLDHTLPELPKEGVIVDGIFGTGFKGDPDPKTSEVIERVNTSRLPIISLDVPSGLDAQTGSVSKTAIQATLTCAIEYPKIGFFLKEGWNHIGALSIVPIGLKAYLDENKSPAAILEEEDVAKLLPTISRSRHKYKAGHVVGLAGAKGMAGASLLASYAALKAGAGIVHLLHDEECTPEFAGTALEVVKVPFKRADLAVASHWIERGASCFFGPGLGLDPNQFALLDKLWQGFKTKKLVIDADALSWLKNIKEPLFNCIVTPHLGELEKLLGISAKEGVGVEHLRACQQFVDERNTHLVLKGGPTFLFSKGMRPQIVTEGDPGMATAGAGDVLTGILAALLAQGLGSQHAMQLGVYLHGKAGSNAARNESSYSITASSIISSISAAYLSILGQNLPLSQPWHINLS